MQKVLITSSLLYDYIMDFDEKFKDHILPGKLDSMSITFMVDNLSKNFGGNGGNIAYTLSLLSVPSTLLTSIGANDAQPFIEHLQKHGIDTNYINIVKNEFTGVCFIMTDKFYNQITAYYPGALQKDTQLDIAQVRDLARHELLVITTSTPEAQVRFVKQAVERTIPFLYAPGQEIARLNKEELERGIYHAKILIVNDYELAFILKITGLTKKELLKKTALLVTTLGSKGSTIETRDTIIHIPAAKSLKVVDPTGAGDSYIAGFVAGYVKNFSLKTCGQMGALAATFATEQYGTQKHTFSIKEYIKRYQESFHESLSL